MTRQTAAALLLILNTVWSCGRPRTTVAVAADDPEMAAAIAQARATVPQFLAAMKTGSASDEAFSVKMAIRDGDDVEHFWVGEIRYDGTVLTGTLGNDPELVHGHKLGEPVSVKASEISDWMYLHDGVLVGGYSIRLIRNRMAPAEREEMDREAGFRFE